MGINVGELEDFLKHVFLKLRKMKVPTNFHTYSSKKKIRFKNLLLKMGETEELKGHITLADGLNIPENMKLAARQAAEKKYQVEEERVLSMLSTVIESSWEAADALARALVFEMTRTERDKQSERGSDPEQNPSWRFFLHVVIPCDLQFEEFFQRVAHGWPQRFEDSVTLVDFGWLQGGISCGDEATVDAAYIIVSLRDLQIMQTVKSWLGELGALRISSPLMAEVSVKQLSQDRGDGEN